MDVRGGDCPCCSQRLLEPSTLVQALFQAAEEAAEAKKVRITGQALISDRFSNPGRAFEYIVPFSTTERSLVMPEPYYEVH